MSYFNDRREKFITRVTDKAWWVRVLVKNKVLFSRFFTDNVHGGTEGAYRKAVDCKKEALKTIRIDTTRTKKGYNEVSKYNRTTVIGVHLTKKITKYGIYFSWRAMTGTNRGMSFSVKLHGYEQAFMKAVKYRYQTIEQPVPENIAVPSPESLLQGEELRILQNQISMEQK